MNKRGKGKKTSGRDIKENNNRRMETKWKGKRI